MSRLTIVLAVMVALALVACTGEQASSPTTPATTAPSVSSTTATSGLDGNGLPVPPVPAFAPLTDVPLLIDTPPYGGPATPHSIDGLYRAPSYDLDAAAIGRLEEQGFVIVPGDARLLHPLYQTGDYDQGEVYFVTTDAGYHYLHLAFSKLLRELERTELMPVLDHLLLGLVDGARAQRDDLTGTDLAEPADRVAQLYEAAATLAELDVGPIGSMATAEVQLGRDATELTRSPITGLGPADATVSMKGLVDFSLFKPRGHYTRSADLERYFRAVSLLGNESFAVDREDTMVLAALATRVLVTEPALVDDWTRLYETTGFLVGTADDYTPLELADQLDRLAAGWRDDPSQLDAAAAGAAGKSLLDARQVGIDPEAAAVRLMGARFVVDSYIYDQLRFPSVGDPPHGRIYATPLDLVAALGSDTAYQIMDSEGDLTDPGTGRHWTNYDDHLASLRTELNTRPLSAWASTVYDSWLYALLPVWSRHGDAFPDFMRSEAWQRRGLQAGLGSYTELKHDTVLYAKQSFAAEGAFEPPDFPEPRHWVEPDPAAFGRMQAVVTLLRAGLSDRGLLPADSDNARLLNALDAFLARLTGLARDELAGRPISAEDNTWLATIGSTMEALWIRSSDQLAEVTEAMPDQDRNAAVAVDIMRTTAQILEIGTGYFDSLYVLVPADDGRFQVARGAVYSYYQFWRDEAEGRLTDEEWWQLLDSGPQPRPTWQDPLLPS